MTQGMSGAAPPAVPAVIEPSARSLSVTAAYMDPGRLESLRRFSAIIVDSRLAPAHIQTWQQAFTILVMGDSLGIHPWVAISNCYVVYGKVGCEAKLLLAMIQRTGELEEFTLDGDATKATCRMKRRGQQPIQRTITIADAEKARWTKTWKKNDKGEGSWVEKEAWRGMPDLMLQWRVLSRVSRLAFADVVLGMYVADELDIPTRIEGTEVVVDAEAVAVELQPATVAQAEVREAEKQERDPATEFQRQVVSTLFAEKGKDGKALVPPAERKKWSQALAADGSSSVYAACIDSLQAIITEAKDREGEQGGAHSAPPIQGGLL